MSEQISPLPWGHYGPSILDAQCHTVADCSGPCTIQQDQENAAFIVQAVNSHAELVKLAEEVAKPYEDAADWKDAIGKLQAMANEALNKTKSAQ